MGQVNYNDVQYTLFAHSTGTSAITTSPVILYKIHCVTATATEDFEIRDGSGGNMILDIKASTAINTSFDFENGIKLQDGIHVTVGSSATGTLRFDYSVAQ